jgi:hypothetical protein
MQHRLACLCLARLLLTRQQEGPDVLKTHRHTTKANTGVNSCCVRLISLDTTEVGGLAAQQPTAVDPAHISADTKQDARPVGHRPTAAAAPFKGSDKNCVTRTQDAGHAAQQPTAAIAAQKFSDALWHKGPQQQLPFSKVQATTVSPDNRMRAMQHSNLQQRLLLCTAATTAEAPGAC